MGGWTPGTSMDLYQVDDLLNYLSDVIPGPSLLSTEADLAVITCACRYHRGAELLGRGFAQTGALLAAERQIVQVLTSKASCNISRLPIGYADLLGNG